MANNRMYLLCTLCAQDDHTPLEDCLFFLAKYYPNTGWYIRGGKTLQQEDGTAVEFVDVADAFFDRHKHGGMYGEYMLPVFEDLIDPTQRAKREIISVVQKTIDRSAGG